MRRGSEEFRERLADSLDFQATGIGASRRCKGSWVRSWKASNVTEEVGVLVDKGDPLKVFEQKVTQS